MFKHFNMARFCKGWRNTSGKCAGEKIMIRQSTSKRILLGEKIVAFARQSGALTVECTFPPITTTTTENEYIVSPQQTQLRTFLRKKKKKKKKWILFLVVTFRKECFSIQSLEIKKKNWGK
ncbi:hypothetical protein POVWA1_041230 [Plasmodium ovale wallikeri]|uniref:Uncharacterized protein n=1 Tax=Plasmodium ovale wallikeri TaxID=864142 RepID=A0A1A8Z860_PLAOA|nr:hypothetical protein POVWA1_041230 [Plasmodium ovale wallikeri]